MKRAVLRLMALGCAATLGVSPLAAQKARLDIGAGGVVPSGDYSTVDNAGWHMMGALELSIPRSPLHVRVDAMYGQTTHQGGLLLTGSTKLSGASADALYYIGAPMLPLRLYLLGGIGYYKVDPGAGASESNVAFNGGGGVTLGVGPVKMFGEARFITVRTSGGATNFFPLSVGLSLGM